MTVVAIETDPTLSPSRVAPSPAAPASDASREWLGGMRAGIKARLFADTDAAPDAPLRPSSAAPTRIGRYVVIKRIGAGGMGVVYAAYDDKLDRKVAVKLLRPGYGPVSETARARLLREAQAIAKLSHRAIVQVYEVGTHHDEVFVAMEYVEGSTLKQWQPSRDWRDILARYLDAGRGLCAAHAAGIVHRDFKADNVLVRASDLAVRVVDFGLARTERQDAMAVTDLEPDAAEVEPSLTHTGLVMGTPAYMAPEQHLATTTDARTDQFSFCASLFEALYGYRAFTGERLDELRANVLAGRVEPAPRYTAVPPNIHKVLARGLAVDPDARHPTMEALLAVLELPKPSRPWRRIAWALGLTAVAVGGSVAWSNADAGALSPDAMRVRAAYDTAARADTEAELRRLRARPVPQRWNDLVLAYATTAPDATTRLAALKHLSTADAQAIPAARNVADEALRRGPVFAVRPTPARVTAIAVSPDTKDLCAITEAGALLRWSGPDDPSAELVATAVVDAAFSGDGRLRAVLPEGRLATIDPDGSTTIQRLHGGELTSVAADGRGHIAVGADDGTLFLLRDGESRAVREHEAAIGALAYQPGGSTLASGDRSGRVTLWFLDRQTHRSMTVDHEVQALAWMHDGETVVAETADGPVAWDGKRGTPGSAPLPRDTTDFAVSRSTETVLHRSPEGLGAILADGARMSLDRSVSTGPFALSSDGRWAVAGDETGLRLWRTGTDDGGIGPRGERLVQLNIEGIAVGLHVLDGHLLVVTSRGKVLLENETGFEQLTEVGIELQASIASPHGLHLAVESSPEGIIHIVDLEHPERNRPLPQLEGTETGPLAWSPDGTVVAKLHCPATRTSCDVSLHPIDGSTPWSAGPVPAETIAMHVSPAGDRVALQHGDHLTLFDTARRDGRTFSPPAHMKLLAADFSRAGALRLASFDPGSGVSKLHVEQLDEDGDMRTLFVQDGLRRLTPTAARDGLVLATSDERALLWQLEQERFVEVPAAVLDAPADALVHVAPEGARLWVGEAESEMVTLFDLSIDQHQRLPRPTGTPAWLHGAAWAELMGPRTIREWGASAPRDGEAFVRWLDSRTELEIPLEALRGAVSPPDEPL